MPKSVKKWRVSRIKGNAAHNYGTVEAPSADAAVRKVVQEYKISDPAQEEARALRVPELQGMGFQGEPR